MSGLNVEIGTNGSNEAVFGADFTYVRGFVRNPATYFQRLGFIGVQAEDGDSYTVYGNPAVRNAASTPHGLPFSSTLDKGKGR